MVLKPLDIPTTADSSLTLFDLQRMVRSTLETRFADPVWISAEVSELKVNRSGHCYLNLVEKGNNEAQPRAEARAVIWRSAYSSLAASFAATTGDELRAGLRLLVRVVVTYHEVYGFSLQIIDIDPSYTLGEVERRRRETIAQLQADGVWDMNREVEPSRPLLRIAVVSSATAAGYRDFMQELSRAPYALRTTLFESQMQGEGAEESVINALLRIAAAEDEFDAVALIRGGGSTSDLALFDSYRIASHVAQFPLPIFTGIGHDKDVSVADMVAYRMCKTPTAVATTFAEMLDAEMMQIEDYALQLRSYVAERLSCEKVAHERISAELSRSAILLLTNLSHRLDRAEESIAEGASQLLRAARERVDSCATVVDSFSLDSLLRMGFAVMRGVRSIDDVTVGDSVSISLCDGEVDATVTKTKKRV
ncbi:MAG: exodeoxyribonuclease VII large subunit [Alistipes sp.]|nr:exodeoxyribonuclease VII large subunit [Alistipes sp.]